MSDTPPIQPTRAASASDMETAHLLSIGEPDGLRRLMTNYAGRVRAALRREFGGRLDSLELDEVMSHAAQQAWDAADQFNSARSSLGAWFLALARICASRLVHLKSRHKTVPLSRLLPAGRESVGEGGDEELLDAYGQGKDLLVADIYHFVGLLPPLQRAVLMADLEAGMTVPAARLAKELGTSTNSIYVSRTNGRKALRVALMQRRRLHVAELKEGM